MEDYTGLAAAAWQLFSGEEPGRDYVHFRQVVREGNGPSLDVGSATGRLLLPLLAEGLDVEGVEPSADMLAICRARAAERGLAPVLYSQRMQELDLPRRYRTILVPCGTFQLVIDREERREALRRLHAHLQPGGTLALTNFTPPGDLDAVQWGQWQLRARAALPDGTEIEKHASLDGADRAEQILRCSVRYRRFRGEALVEEQLCSAPERWYTAEQLALILEEAGFRVSRILGDYSDEPYTAGHGVMTLIAQG